MDESLLNFFVSRTLAPSPNMMLVNYSSVNEEMVDKVKVKNATIYPFKIIYDELC